MTKNVSQKITKAKNPIDNKLFLYSVLRINNKEVNRIHVSCIHFEPIPFVIEPNNILKPRGKGNFSD